MKLFYFHGLLIQGFVLYLITCLFISQSALSVCPDCGSTDDTLPGSALCPSCSSGTPETVPENVRTALRQAIENLSSDHSLFHNERYQRVISVIREQADTTTPVSVTDLLNEMESSVDTLNAQMFPNASDRFQLAMPRSAFTYPLTVLHALNGEVLNREEIYNTASRVFLIVRILFTTPTTGTREQQQREQQLASSLFEGLFLYYLLNNTEPDSNSFFTDALQAYVDSYQSQLLHFPLRNSVSRTAGQIDSLLITRLSIHGVMSFGSSLIPNTVTLRRIASNRPNVILERTINDSTYIAVYRLSLPPVEITLRPDQSVAVFSTLRGVLSSNPEMGQLQAIYESLNFLEPVSHFVHSSILCIGVMAGFLANLDSKRFSDR